MRCTWRCWSGCGSAPTSSTSCISISTTIRSRCSRASRRRSSPRCTAGSTCPSTSRCSTPSRARRWSRSPTRSGARCRRRNWIKTIHHGLPEKLLAPKPVKPAYLAFLGRIAPEKRVDRAIRIAEQCGIPLKIAAKVDRADRDYYEEEIRPMIDSPNVEYIGEISDARKVGVPQRRDRAAGADRLARAVRPGDDRGDGVRHAGHRVQSRLGAGDHRGRPHRLRRRGRD